MAETLRWWLVLEGIGLLALPVTLSVFANLQGRGYAFAKPLGLLVGGYCFWLALSLHLLPNRPGSIVWAYLPLAIASIWIVRRRRQELLADLEQRAGFILAVEVVFTAALFTAAHLRSFIPEIAGTEKPMDFMMLNAASRSTYYPPQDAWLAGESVSYYYFGYVLQAMLGKLAALPTAVVFNLGVAGTAALVATAAFGLGYEVARLAKRLSAAAALAAGAFAVVLVLLMGNLEGVLEFGIANDVVSPDVARRVDIANLDQANASDACLPLPFVCVEYPTERSSFWWWWRATRISPDANSITEFPFFSFLLGDLHPHVMSIPFVLTVVGLGLSFWRMPRAPSFETWLERPWLLLVCAVLIGGLGFLNTWDLPAFGFLVAALVVLRCLRESPDAGAALGRAAGFLAPLALLSVLLYLPFYLSFSSQAAGLRAETGEATRPLHSALFWTPLLLANLPLLVAALWRKRQEMGATLWRDAALLPAGVLLAWGVIVLGRDGAHGLSDAISRRGWNWLTALFFAAALSLAVLALLQGLRRRGPNDEQGTEEDDGDAALVPVLAALATGLLLVLGSELFFIKDMFGTRLNTVFKLSYQAWLILGFSGAYGLLWLARTLAPQPSLNVSLGRAALAATAALVFGGALLYPLGATLSRTDGLARERRTLNGIDFLRQNMPDDFAALTWLSQRAGRNERLVEAIGGQYSPAARISGSTGVPGVLGWPGHELQWGRDSATVLLRQDEVNRAYSTPSLEEALTILRKYRVTYVVVGQIERQTYPAAGLEKFENGLPSVFISGATAIYRVPVQQAEGLGRAP